MWIFVLIILNEGHGVEVFKTTALLITRGHATKEEAGV
jgi:hypothetical protein